MLKDKIVFDPKEVAALLGLHVNSVYKLANAGELRSFKLGKRVLIPKSEIERLLSGEKETTPKGG
jgi:excisionase family DNA binding protein